MRRLLNACKNDSGLAAIEFALILPILVGLVLVGLDGWLRINQVSQMQSALQTGSRYYESGGADDAAAAQFAMRGWAARPADANVQAARTCSCAGAGASCTSLCAGNALPAVYVTLTATGTFSSLIHSQTLTESGMVRLR